MSRSRTFAPLLGLLALLVGCHVGPTVEEQFGGFPVCGEVACVCSQWTIGTGHVCGACMHLHHELVTRSC